MENSDILTPSEYLKINTDRDMTGMKKWNSEMVNSILRNENYTGILWQNELQKEKFITIALTTIEKKL